MTDPVLEAGVVTRAGFTPAGARISGVGKAVPDKFLTNEDLAKLLDTNDEWIASRTGIRKRHIISGDETLTSLAAAAAEEAMKDAGVEAKDIDLVILATSSPVGLHNRRRIGRHRMN